MGAQTLSSRAIIGEFYRTLEQEDHLALASMISMIFTSDQDGEQYNWLGQSPQMREWIGGRNAKGFRENGIFIKNKHFESTIEVLVSELRRDKTGQIMVRIRELAERTNSHWIKLLSALIINGESTPCYDNQFFFDTDHQEGDSGIQSNIVSVDISTLPVEIHGTITNPSIAEFQLSVLEGITRMCSFLDDVGEPMNETANNFVVCVPTSLYMVANDAFTRRVTDLEQRIPNNLNISFVQNTRLNAWTDQFAIFRTDGSVKAFIRQQETNPTVKAKAEGSEFEFDNDMHQYGVDAWRNVGYGYWQYAVLVKMI